jgi:hypothetical protein
MPVRIVCSASNLAPADTVQTNGTKLTAWSMILLEKYISDVTSISESCSMFILLLYIDGTDAVFHMNPFGRNKVLVCAKEINFCTVNINAMEIKE